MQFRRPRATLISAAVFVALGVGLGACTVAGPGVTGDVEESDSLLVRADVQDLSAAEKAEFVDAILAMKRTPAVADGRVTNLYDSFVATHLSKLMCWTYDPTQGGWGHDGPDLLTWHRAFLLDFEQELAEVAGHPIAIPYWDWTDDASTAAVFSDDFMGNLGVESDGYAVTTGPFRAGEWEVSVRGIAAGDIDLPDHLVRATGTIDDALELPSTEEVTQALLRDTYDAAPWTSAADPNVSFRQYIDGGDATGLTCDSGEISFVDVKPGSLRLHSTVHLWVGGQADGAMGSLADTATSPNDPVFWLHHANIDRILEAWWIAHDYEYLPVSGGPHGNNIDDQLYPYTYTNGDMAVSTVSLGYAYDVLPTAGGTEEAQPVVHEGTAPAFHH